MSSPSATAPAKPLSTARMIAFGSVMIPAPILTSMLTIFLMPYYAGHVGMSVLAIGATVSSVRLIDLFFDVPLGWAMDHTRTPVGRYRAWYLVGAPLLMLGTYLLFVPPHGAGASYLFVASLVMGLGMSTLPLAHAAWAATLATGYDQRSRIFAWIAAVGVVGSVIFYGLPFLTHNRFGPAMASSVPTIAWAIIGMTVFFTVIVTAITPEPETPSVKREKVVWGDYWRIIARPTALRLVIGDLMLVLGAGFTLPMLLWFFQDVKHFTANQATTFGAFSAVGVLAAPFWAKLASRLGKHRTLQLGCLAYAAVQTLFVLAIPAGQYWPTAIGMFGLAACSGVFILMTRAMLADYADQLRLEQGVQRVGLLFSAVTTTMKVGGSLSAVIVAVFLTSLGYHSPEHGHNSAHAIQGLKLLYLFGPVIFSLLGGACFFGYSLDAKRHGEIRAQLDARDAALAAAAAAETLPGGGLLAPAAE